MGVTGRVSTGDNFDTAPAAIEARAIRFSTPAGLKGVLVPKKTRGGSVSAFITLRFGDEKSLMGKSISGDLAASMLMRGTAKHTRQQIADAFDKLKAQVNVFGGAENAMAVLETTRENLPEVLKLVTEILREPSFPVAEFEVLRQEELSGAEQERTEPTAKAQRAYRRHQSPFGQGHPRYVSTTDEGIAELKAARLEDVQAFYHAFYGAANGEISIVGDFDAKEIQALVGQLLGNWKSPQPFTRIQNQYKGTEALNTFIETPEKANAFFLAGLNLQVQDTDPEYPGLVLGNFMTGGGFLNSRLAPGAAGEPGPGPRAGQPHAEQPVRRPDLGLQRRAGEEGGRSDQRSDPGGPAQASRPFQDQHREGGRLRQGEEGRGEEIGLPRSKRNGGSGRRSFC